MLRAAICGAACILFTCSVSAVEKGKLVEFLADTARSAELHEELQSRYDKIRKDYSKLRRKRVDRTKAARDAKAKQLETYRQQIADLKKLLRSHVFPTPFARRVTGEVGYISQADLPQSRGLWGRLDEIVIRQKISDTSALVDMNGRTAFVSDIDLSAIADSEIVDISNLAFEVVDPYQYTTVAGARRTVPHYRPFDLEPYYEEAEDMIGSEMPYVRDQFFTRER